MIDAIAETAPRKSYTEVEGDDSARIYLLCNCGQVIKKRRDSFVPKLHVIHCLACNNFSTDIAPAVEETAAQQTLDLDPQ